MSENCIAYSLAIILILSLAPSVVASEEPDCDCDVVVEQQPARGPVRGIADTHAHQFSNLAFGGALLWGKPFDEDGIEAALAPGDFTWDFKTVGYLDEFLPPYNPNGPAWPVPFKGYPVHFDASLWILSDLTEEAGSHLHNLFNPSSWGGASSYAGWPRWNTTTHQQMYYRWLERAYKGGLRLMVMHTVNNAVICRLPITRKRAFDSPISEPGSAVPKWFDCDDMYAVDLQLDEVKALEKFIDLENDGVLDGDGWYRIVYSPYEARQAIRQGKLAVVLGIEVDSLFGCDAFAECDEETIVSKLNEYYDKGVRHILPVHLYDNLFGASAVYNELWPYTSPLGTGQLAELVDCELVKNWLSGPLQNEDAVYDFDLNEHPISTSLKGLFDFLRVVTLGLIDLGQPFGTVDTAHCNAAGITAKGEQLVNAMMDKKVIVDVEHISLRALDRVLEIADARDYPVISSHSFLHEVPLTEHGKVNRRSEGHRTSKQIDRIRELGGIVAPLNPRKEGSSTRDYVHMYRYIVNKMKEGPYGPEYPGIAYASDWGAMFLQTAPRCENAEDCAGPPPKSCSEDFKIDDYPKAGCLGKDFPRLDYPFEAVGTGGMFHKQETGGRTFDFNTDGLAHVGLLPDFFKDLTQVGLKEEELEPMFNSAEVYIRMWEKIHGGPPVITPVIDGTLGDKGWYVSDVTVSWDIDSESTVYGTDGCDPVTIDADTAGVTLSCWVASDGGEAEMSVTIKRDTDPPVVACTADPSKLWPPNHKMKAITVATTFNDSLSGIATMLLTTVMSSEPDAGDPQGDITGFELGSTATSGALRSQRLGEGPGREYALGYTGYDLAGNTASCRTTVAVVHDQRKDH